MIFKKRKSRECGKPGCSLTVSFYWPSHRLPLSVVFQRPICWAAVSRISKSLWEGESRQTLSLAHARQVDVPFVDLFLDAAAAMDTMRVCLLAAAFLLPSVSSPPTGLWPHVHLCMLRDMRNMYVCAVSVFFFPDFRAPTLERRVPHQHISTRHWSWIISGRFCFWVFFFLGGGWPTTDGWPWAACPSPVTHFYSSHWNKNQNGGELDVWEALYPVRSSALTLTPQQSSSHRFGHTYMPNGSFIISAALWGPVSYLAFWISPQGGRPGSKAAKWPSRLTGHRLAGRDEVRRGVTLQASLASHNESEKYACTLRKTWYNQKTGSQIPKYDAAVRELFVLGCIFRQLV